MKMAYKTERIPGVPISLGESICVPEGSLRDMAKSMSTVRRHGRSTSESSTAQSTARSRLPPAVATVPADHIRGYVHNKRVNSYLVGNLLGEGSFAKVKEAFHIQVGEKVAMKVIDKKKAQQDAYVAKNFRREARLLQMVRHPNILHLLEVIETDTSFYLISELCSGGELMKHIYSKGKLDEVETRKYMRQIISSVDHLHRAGIIHRDLKVENMLLDANMDLRIIDFGLSNEEYIEGENGRIHCNTQCGSPAYAAPELLGHKEYGPEVDIWSIGVNMYAMLTGCLPYTVEPFNITALHAKMLENKMNPIPDSLSSTCKDLLHRLLEANPERRIKMDAIMAHDWINESHTLPFGPAPYPNNLTTNSINRDIVDHMIHTLKVEISSEEDLVQELMSNKATTAACVYFLLAARLDRYQKRYPAKRTRVRHKSIRLSQDHGFFEDVDDNDSRSIKSMPSRRPAHKRTGYSRPTQVSLREKKGREGLSEQPFSHPPLNEDQEIPPPVIPEARLPREQRRLSLPPTVLNDQMKRFHESREHRTRKISPISNSSRKPKFSMYTSQDNVEEHDEMDYLNESLSPVSPSRGMSRNYSHGHALNQLRQDLKDKLHPPQAIQTAWRSNPGSRNPSRHGSRIPSSTLTRHAPTQGGLEEVQDEEESAIEFHTVKSKTLPRNFKGFASLDADGGTHLPSLHPPPPSRGGRHHMPTDHLHTRTNGLKQNSGDTFNIKTDRSIDEILTEMLRVATNVKMRESELHGNTLKCNWKGVRFAINVYKQGAIYQIKFKWFSGGDLHTHKELCEKFIRKLKLV